MPCGITKPLWHLADILVHDELLTIFEKRTISFRVMTRLPEFDGDIVAEYI
jgi:hypothetical protein